jgi:hypothetical protein
MKETEQHHKLMRVIRFEGTSYRCVLCGKTFDNLTAEEEICEVPRRSTVTGVIRIDTTAMDAMLARLFGAPPSSPLPKADNKEPVKDSAQQKGDALASQIEKEWGRDE